LLAEEANPVFFSIITHVVAANINSNTITAVVITSLLLHSNFIYE